MSRTNRLASRSIAMVVCLSLACGSLVYAANKKAADANAKGNDKAVSSAQSADESTDASTAPETRKAKDKAKKKKTTALLALDPSAEQVDFFESLAKGSLDATIIPRDSKSGNVFIENTTDKPLTIAMPDAFVGVQVLKQYGGRGGGFGGGGFGGGGFGGGMMGGMGGAQSFGGGTGTGSSRTGTSRTGTTRAGRTGGGEGFFSVPPDKIVRVEYSSVCLEHGKREPTPGMRYRPVQVEQYSKDPVLKQLLTRVANQQIDTNAAQAAAWHVANGMSWEQLADKRLGVRGANRHTPYFAPETIASARNTIALVTAEVREEEEKAKRDAPETEPEPVRTRTSNSALID
jgi:hypothetical protein